MSRSAIQFQKGLSLLEFQRLFGSEEQCEAALEKTRWPVGFRCPRCDGHDHGLVYGRRLKRYQCCQLRSSGHPHSTFHAFNFDKEVLLKKQSRLARLQPRTMAQAAHKHGYPVISDSVVSSRQMLLSAIQRQPGHCP